MRRKTRTLILVMVLMAMASTAFAQESLKDVVEQQGFEWMIGQWKKVGLVPNQIVLPTGPWYAKFHH